MNQCHNPRTKQSDIKAYEYDAVYNTRVNRRWSNSLAPIFIGSVFIFLGKLSIIFTSIDLIFGASQSPYFNNPNYQTNGMNPFEDINLASSWQENSIWPTLGKGIWVGLIMISTGILSISSKLDGSQISVSVFNTMCWITLVLSFYMSLSSIFSIEVYPYNSLPTSNLRTDEQNIEYLFNFLLLITGLTSVVTSLIGALVSCIILDYCSNGRKYPKYRRYAIKQEFI